MSSYRPSFSGGTYRSSPIKRDLLSQFSSSIPSATKPSTTDTLPKSTIGVSKYGKSRDPSPAVKSRDPSPANQGSHLRCKSRDPSPSIKNGDSTYQSPYRSAARNVSTTSSYTPRYRSTSSLQRTTTIPDKSISYLSSSDFRGKSSTRTREKRFTSRESKNNSPSPEVEIEKDNKQEERESFISVNVVTRGTSPTPPNSTTVVRTRRLELAKTIEKVIQRSTKKVESADKEVQSDRMDDPTRYSRFSNISSSRISTSVSPRYSQSSSISPEKSPRYQDSKPNSISPEKSPRYQESKPSSISPEKSPKYQDSKSSSISPEKSVKSSSSASQSPAKSVSQLLPPINSSPSSKSSSPSNSKLPNKDFRKSALNVGPTNRSRKLKKSERKDSSPESSSVNSSSSPSEKVNSNKTKIKENTDDSINKDIPTGVTHPRRKSSSSSTSSSSSDSTSSSSMSPFVPTDSSIVATNPTDAVQPSASLSEEFTVTTSIDYNNSMNTSQDVNTESEFNDSRPIYKIRHFESGEIGWWLKDDEEEEQEEEKDDEEKEVDDDDTYAESIKTLNQDEVDEKNGDNTDSDFVNVTETKEEEVTFPRWWKNDNIASIKLKVCRVESGERAWWLDNDNDEEKDAPKVAVQENNGLGNRTSPEGVENLRVENRVSQDRRSKSPYDNVQNENSESSVKCNPTEPQYWGHHKNIDDVLGGANRPIFSFLDNYLEEISPDQVVIHDSTAQMPFIQRIEK